MTDFEETSDAVFFESQDRAVQGRGVRAGAVAHVSRLDHIHCAHLLDSTISSSKIHTWVCGGGGDESRHHRRAEMEREAVLHPEPLHQQIVLDRVI